MNREDIIRMAREAGFPIFGTKVVANDPLDQIMADAVTEHYHETAIQFAALVAAAEREACAVIAETPFVGEQDDITMQAKDRVADVIRARGQG